MEEAKVITMRVAACAAEICEIAGVRPDGPTGEWIAELVQSCCEEELDEACGTAEAPMMRVRSRAAGRV